MFSRMLAGFIDYLVLMSLSILTTRFFFNPDLLFIPNFVLSGLYLGLGASSASSGQTLGKKAFRLRVVTVRTGRPSPYLNPFEGFLRYFALIGVLIVLTDIPPLLYRRIGFVADPTVLEFHMWFALSYTITSLALVLLSPSHRGLHDLAVQSIVVRANSDLDPGGGSRALNSCAAAAGSRTALLLAPLAGIVFGTLMWLQGVVTEPQVAELVSHRFELERRYPIRVQGMRVEPEGATIACEVSSDYGPSNLPLPDSQTLALNLTKGMIQDNLINPADVKAILFIFSRIVPNDKTGITFSVERIKIDTAGLNVTTLPEEF